MNRHVSITFIGIRVHYDIFLPLDRVESDVGSSQKREETIGKVGETLSEIEERLLAKAWLNGIEECIVNKVFDRVSKVVEVKISIDRINKQVYPIEPFGLVFKV